MSYLADVTIRLAGGLARVAPLIRQRHMEYLRAAQQPDGGFAGRDGGSDLYYTGFGLRGLAILGALDRDVAQRAACFLQQHLAARAPIMDVVSLVQAACLLEMTTGADVFAGSPLDWRGRARRMFQQLRRADGGYARSHDAEVSSTYQTFLVAVSLQLIGAALVEPQRLVEFVLGRRREDGGFVEIGPIKRSGTNPTAAAIGILTIAGAPEDQVRHEASGFLCRMQTPQGGMRANTRIPEADLLSTFAAVLTLSNLNALDRMDTTAAGRFVHSLALPGGGFRGAAWDPDGDVEYSFYGLGTLGLLAEPGGL